jgi:folate-binding protein YgfZ
MSQPLRAIYERSGARFAEIRGERLPECVSGFESEYEAAMSGAVVLERFQRGQIGVTGADRESFLHNMLTNDIRNLDVGAGLPAAFLTNKGKLVSDLLVSKESETIRLRMEASRAEPLRTALDRYVISEDVALASLDDLELVFSVSGPRAAQILSTVLGIERAELDTLPHLGLKRAQADGAPVRLLGYRRELTPRFDLSAPRAYATELFTKIAEGGAVMAGYALSETRRIEAGVPRFGIDMDESNLPLEAGLDEAISFEKGCYIGQEYVVRLAHRGHLNRKLVGLRVAGDRVPSAAQAICSATEEVGQVTCAALSPHFHSILALGYVKRPHFDPGSELQIEGERAVVSSVPFRLAD